MGILLNVQLSVFGNHNIEVTPENISILMGEINKLDKFKYLPSIVTGQHIDLSTGKINTTSNLSLITESQLSQIVCLDNRIDCSLNFNPEKQDSINNSLQFCKDVLSIIMDKFSIQGNRLAINIHELSDSCSQELLKTKLWKSITPIFNFYKDKIVDEWMTRVNYKYSINISEKPEKLNVITELNLAQHNQNKEKRMLCHLDINTIPENQKFRFSKDDLSSFISESEIIICDIIDNFGELDRYE